MMTRKNSKSNTIDYRQRTFQICSHHGSLITVYV
jgi:hypothetical protein